jgi:hypothetical protein
MIDCANSFADRDMFARFARIGVGHQIQYILPNATEDENFVGDDDDELLAEGDLEPSTSNAGGQILDSNVGNCQNQALGDETDGEDDVESDEDDVESDEDDAEPDEEEDIESDAQDDEGCSSEDNGESEDEGPDFKF